jgi:hypothetical protein
VIGCFIERRPKERKKWKLFVKHQKLIEQRALREAQDKKSSFEKRTGEIVAFFVPRVNYFLGKPLVYAGVYPDGVIRLIKKNKARLPGKSVHELMEIDGEVAWLFNHLEHHDSPTIKRYIERANRYTDLHAKELGDKKTPKNPLYLIYYSLVKPTLSFISLYFRHKGFLDGMRGFVWSLFSALHFPIAYFKYWQLEKGKV